MFKEQAVKSVRCRDKFHIKYWINVWITLYGAQFENCAIQVYPYPTYKREKREKPEIKLPFIRPPAVYDNPKYV